MTAGTTVFGIDIGGTSIKALACAADGAVITEVTRPTGDTGDASWMEQVRLVYTALRRECPTVAAVGVCAPGLAAKDEHAIVSMPGRLRGLEGKRWADEFSAPTVVLNDAHAALLGEVWLGAARGAENALMLTLGTGVGGAVMVDQRLLRGHLGRAGHLGHVSLDPKGRPGIVGTPGSLEEAIGECSLPRRTDGRFARTTDLMAAVNAGDQEARRLWLESVRALAAAVTSFINVFDPATVVIGGGVAQAGDALFVPLRQFLDAMEWRVGDARVAVVPAELGARGGAFGAAYRARQTFCP